MKSKNAFGLAILYTALVSFMIYIQLINSPVFNLLFWIGIAVYMASGAFFIGSSYIDNKKYMTMGLIVGIASWTLLLIGASWGVSINHDIIERWKLWDALSSYIDGMDEYLAFFIDNLDEIIKNADLQAFFSAEIIVQQWFVGPFVYYVIVSITTVISIIIGVSIGFISFKDEQKVKEISSSYSKGL